MLRAVTPQQDNQNNLEVTLLARQTKKRKAGVARFEGGGYAAKIEERRLEGEIYLRFRSYRAESAGNTTQERVG